MDGRLSPGNPAEEACFKRDVKTGGRVGNRRMKREVGLQSIHLDNSRWGNKNRCIRYGFCSGRPQRGFCADIGVENVKE